MHRYAHYAGQRLIWRCLLSLAELTLLSSQVSFRLMQWCPRIIDNNVYTQGHAKALSVSRSLDRLIPCVSKTARQMAVVYSCEAANRIYSRYSFPAVSQDIPIEGVALGRSPAGDPLAICHSASLALIPALPLRCRWVTQRLQTRALL